MKIYNIIRDYDYEGREVQHVFKTREDAELVLKHCLNDSFNSDNIYIEEEEVYTFDEFIKSEEHKNSLYFDKSIIEIDLYDR